MTSRSLMFTALLALGVCVSHARGAGLDTPTVLVATEAGAQSFGETVVLAVPLADGTHFGFILNQPTQMPLSSLFPGEEASSKVESQVHVGGPAYSAGVFAVVREHVGQPTASRSITPDLSVALSTDDVDRVIAQRASDARFFVGMMVWQLGELSAEVRRGAWQVLAADAELVLSATPALLWPRLAERARYRNAKRDDTTRFLQAQHFVNAARVPDPAAFPRGFRLHGG